MMPATSLKQKKFMDAVAHNPAFAKKAGVPQSVGEDFSSASKGMKFGKGSETRVDSQAVNNPKTNHGQKALFSKGGNMATKKMFGGKESMKEELAEAKAIKSGKISPMQYAKGEKSEPAMKKGGSVKKMANGGMTSVRTAAPSRDGIASKGKTKGTQVKMSGSKPLGMKKGGKAYC
jgi:hypothetical protein